MQVEAIVDDNLKRFDYETEGASGIDLRANIELTTSIAPGETTLIPTGVYLNVPNGYEAVVRPRSGLALKHGVTVLNAPGTIDSDYQKEVGVILINHGNEPFSIDPQDRVAQLVFQSIEYPEIVFVNQFSDESERGGFGHTGVK